jgi:hypothetical protein
MLSYFCGRTPCRKTGRIVKRCSEMTRLVPCVRAWACLWGKSPSFEALEVHSTMPIILVLAFYRGSACLHL